MNCKNCHTQLLEADDYCKKCGGKVIRNRLSFKNLFEHISETFFNYDNKLLRTFVQLFKNPEDVIVGYINGVRKKYINPISFFGLSLTISGLSVFIIKKFYLEYFDFSKMFDSITVTQDVMANNTFEGIMEYNSLFYVFLIPLFALISWVVFLNKRYNFVEHIIIYLYSISFLSIMLVIIAQIVLFIFPENYFKFSFLSWPLMFIYNCYVLKRIFKLTYWQLILKSMYFFILFFVAYIIVSLLVLFIMLGTGMVNLEDFRPKQST